MTQKVCSTDAFINRKTRTPRIRSKRRKHPKPFTWQVEPYNHAQGASSMWVAVITQAMMDALSRSRTAESLFHKHEATHWLTSNGRDFVTVCLLAGFDPDYIRRMAKKIIANPRAWRAEPGTGKRYHEKKAWRQRAKSHAPDPEGGSNVINGPWHA